MIDRIITEVRRIAPQLPTGLDDPRAAEKLADELEEMNEKIALGDRIGTLTELADVVYYAGKAVINGLIPPCWAEELISNACAQCDDVEDLSTALYVMQAKYACRIIAGKRDDLERVAVQQAVLDTNSMP
jgi:hypothetical protein